MTEFIEISWTAGSLDEARHISRRLVEERLVACAQIIPWIESVYLWDKQLETMQESKIVLKTVIKNFEQIKQIIENTCKYEIPEITYRTIDGGNEAYLDWMKSSISIHM
jgi:periplasmic divalent cation tolerance protein